MAAGRSTLYFIEGPRPDLSTFLRRLFTFSLNSSLITTFISSTLIFGSPSDFLEVSTDDFLAAFFPLFVWFALLGSELDYDLEI
jgi:hypothetical protein